MNKNEVLITYLRTLLSNYKIKAEYSTNDNDLDVVIVQEVSGEKVVFYGDIEPMFNYFTIDIFGDSIQKEKETSNILGNLIGQTASIKIKNENKVETWRLIFKQSTNPQAIEYKDIRRIGYNLTLQTIITKVYEEVIKWTTNFTLIIEKLLKI